MSTAAPCAAADAPSPAWLTTEVQSFVDDRLAAAIQHRESALVNLLHECFQQELQTHQQQAQHQREQLHALQTKLAAFEREQSHMQSKLDRRVAENNELRKDFYKQLLMLRELVSKQRGDPRAMKALDDVIATVMLGKEKAASFLAMAAPGTTTATAGRAAWGDDRSGSKGELAATDTGASSSLTLRREKDKWEQRARETAAECQQLQEQVLLLQQQLDDARGVDGELWFASAQAGGFERQRITDSVYRSRCSWEDVGDAIVELLNNETIWGAVQGSAFRDKGGRASRGLEALLHRMDSMSLMSDSGGDDNADALKHMEDQTPGGHDKRTLSRRRSAMAQAGRLVACRTCNGCGYLDASASVTNQSDESSANEDDSYLRKTLAQVLELKAALEEANTRYTRLEQELQRSVMDGAKAKEQLERIEFIRSHSANVSLQVDLDAEEEVDLDAIMSAYADPSGTSRGRSGARWKQYEHLIVELKNSLSERDAGLVELRAALADAQNRLVSVQRDSQKAQESHQHAVLALKTSLVLAMKTRNDVIEERQAAVKLLMKNAERKQTVVAPDRRFLAAENATDTSDDADAASSASADEADDVLGDIDHLDEVKRSEVVARRYSEAVSRVHKEFEEQQALLKQVEDELGQDNDKRKRTNSITMGSIVVSMTSHPRDLFKALATAHTDLTNLRRSSQRAAALQTDRLLTLTTHLAHISEELCMVRKRTSAELEYWKLECEKMQNNAKMLTTDLQRTQQQLQEARERGALSAAPGQTALATGCTLCAKHQARLLEISNSMLENGTATSATVRGSGAEDSATSRHTTVPVSSVSDTVTTDAKSSLLTDTERASLGAILLELETLYTTFTSSKQQNARDFITRALVGTTVDSAVASDRSSRSLSVSGSSLSRGTTPSPVIGSTAAQASSAALGATLDVIEEEHGLDPNTILDGRSEGASTRADALQAPPGGRLFQGLIVDSSARGPSTREPLELHGAAIASGGSQTAMPSHHRKKIVRKILTEQEALRRQRARMMQMMNANDEMAHSLLGSAGVSEDDAIDATTRDSIVDDLIPYSTYIDEHGHQIYYVDEEVDDEEGGNGASYIERGNGGSERKDVEGGTSPEPSDRRAVEYSIQIPAPAHTADDEASREQTQSNWSPLSTSPQRHFELLRNSDDISKDPEVITQLRDLVNHNSTSRELLALMNWKILICHWRAQRDQRRLVFMNGLLRAKGDNARFNSTLIHSIRGTMQKLVHFREMMLHSVSQTQADVRKESHRAQAHLIHSVSTILSNLSRKHASWAMASSRSVPLVHHVSSESLSSYTPSPSAQGRSRPRYPLANVHLNEVPQSQVIPTPSFPFSSASEQITPLIIAERASPPLTPSAMSAEHPLGTSASDVPSSLHVYDNRFPQRGIRFAPVGDGDHVSMMHSVSQILPSPGSTLTQSPPKSSLALDSRRARPTKSAGALRHTEVVSDRPVVENARDLMQKTEPQILLPTRPARPQSSPANFSSRSGARRSVLPFPGDQSQ
ncbi:hypothetical protein PINS_up006245 [Pythium insidiosum]|nr:hypothetical protein PINS_up006245 [Pythium insidiosum]